MEDKAKAKRRFCGNCGSHNAYNYPAQVFCSRHYGEGKNPIVETLWCCEEWSPSSQECYCVEEAKKSKSYK